MTISTTSLPNRMRCSPCWRYDASEHSADWLVSTRVDGKATGTPMCNLRFRELPDDPIALGRWHDGKFEWTHAALENTQ